MAAERRFALIVASSQYVDPDLQKLIAPAQDAEALANVLQDANIGGFEVKTLLDEPSYKVNEEIQAFFSDRGRDDLLLLYFSCHGIKDEEGQLYFATSNTSRKLLDATAISANFVNRMMFRSRSRRQLLLLDCCYSGAFAKGLVSRADKKINTGDYFDEGRGRIVLTASDSMQYSFEADKLNVEVKDPGSIFTRAVIDGLNTGKADLDRDGKISYDELYDYTYDRVIDETPLQKPGKWVFGVEGDVIVARNPNWRKEVNNKGPVARAGEEIVTTTTKPKEVTSPKTQSPLQPTSAVSSSPSQPDITNKPIPEEKSTSPALTPVKDFTSTTGQPTIIKKDSSVVPPPLPSSSVPPKPPFIGEQIVKTKNIDSSIGEANDKPVVDSTSITKDDHTSVTERSGKFPASYSSSSTRPIHERKSGLSNPTLLLPILGGGVIAAVIVALIAGGIIHLPGSGSSGNIPTPPPTTPLSPAAPSGPINHNPSATDQSITTNQNTPVNITLAGSDPDKNDTLTAAIVTNPSHGTLGNINQDTGIVTYTPNPNFTGDDSFKFKVNDGKTDSSNIGTVNVKVNGAGAMASGNANSTTTPSLVSSTSLPTATNQSITANENTPVNITLAGSDPNPNATLTAHLVSPPSNGKLSNINQDTGIVTYTPNPNFTGDDSFKFKVNDGKTDSSNTATVNIRVGAA